MKYTFQKIFFYFKYRYVLLHNYVSTWQQILMIHVKTIDAKNPQNITFLQYITEYIFQISK